MKITTLAAPNSAPLANFGHDLATQGGISREQPERDQAVRLATAHGLREIERAVLALAGQPLETAPDQQVQSLREVVALEERAPIDPAGRKILDLRNLFDEAIAFDDSAWGAQLLDGRYGHFPDQLASMGAVTLDCFIKQ